MTESFDIVYQDRAISTPMDIRREFYSADAGNLDAPQCIPCGSTESINGHDGVFHTTSYHFRAGA
ncbi:hypothetical protein [Paraburkholderia sp. RL17-373-BIF-A]|uniref:hypothetical protein n=1 Tax=Paraburkholderia sp. RL17-373-BIF-A TaxID=3031629 RepID=UPI0038B9B46D